MKPGVVCSIVITGDQINFIEFNVKRTQLVLGAYGAFEFSGDNIELFENTVRTISAGIQKHKYTYLVIRHPELITNIMTISGSEDIRSKVLNDLKNTYDLTLSDYYIDFIVHDQDGQQLAIASAIPSHIIDPYLEVLDRYQFKMLAMEPDFAALGRGVNRWASHLTEYLHIDVGQSQTEISIVNHDIIYALRTINFGKGDVVESLAEAGGIDMETAESYLFKYGVVEPDENEELEKNIYQNIAESLDRLGMEIQRTIDYYGLTYKKSAVTNFIITGQLNSVVGLNAYYSKLFSATVESCELSKLVTVKGDQAPDSDELKYIDMCIGAALR